MKVEHLWSSNRGQPLRSRRRHNSRSCASWIDPEGLYDRLPSATLIASKPVADRGRVLSDRNDFQRLMTAGEPHHVAVLHLVCHRFLFIVGA